MDSRRPGLTRGPDILHRQMPLGGEETGFQGLNVVYARFERSEPFTFQVFQGFDSLRVLTYSASIPMTVRMLNLFNTVECVFGYEGVLADFSTILAFQKDLEERLLVAVKSLDDERKAFILERVTAGQARFFVVKDAIAHSKIYLLEGREKKRVVVGSANLSERAFSGKQAETLLVFDDERAWRHYEHEYQVVRRQASNEIVLPGLDRVEVPLEDIPVVRETERSPAGMTLYVNSDVTAAEVPAIVRKVERLAENYQDVTKTLVKPKGGRIEITPRVMGNIVQLVKSHRGRGDEPQEQSWLSVYPDSRKVILSGKEIDLAAAPEGVASDVACLVEYFENFNRGFLGNVAQHQKDYFMFMSWFYMAPFICDLRNNAVVNDRFIFDYPMFAILFGKSNSGKTSLIQTLMMSMFGQWSFVDKANFTGSNLRGLLATKKRFPVVFDDVDRDRFVRHGSDIVKDETFVIEEYPPFVLSMNADRHSFSTEIIKRCLMLYTNASLPENVPTTRELYESVSRIRKGISTALYREYLRRVLERLAKDGIPSDMLRFSSEILTSIFAEHHKGNLPPWCAIARIVDYQSKKYERIQMDLRKLYETNRSIWEIRREEVIIRIPQTERSLQRDVPDWILRPGSKAGQLVLDRRALEEFLGLSFRRWWFPFRKARV
ncbi:MAG: phospholipase D family protein [Chloroflexi bacterium]|nr:phospholipase D family protein [Chloroflexota bacterium]